MKITVTESAFRDAFRDYGRQDSFSYEGLGALFDYIEDLEAGIGQEIELDVIGLCSEYSEYKSAVEAFLDLGYDLPETDSKEEAEEEALRNLREEKMVIEFNGGILVENY